MSDRGTLLDDLKQVKRLKIIYKENGGKREETGPTEKMLELLDKIISTPEMDWILIEKFY